MQMRPQEVDEKHAEQKLNTAPQQQLIDSIMLNCIKKQMRSMQ